MQQHHDPEFLNNMMQLLTQQRSAGAQAAYVWVDPENGGLKYFAGIYTKVVKDFDDLSLRWDAIGVQFKSFFEVRDANLLSRLGANTLTLFKFEITPETLLDPLANQKDPMSACFSISPEAARELIVAKVHFTSEGLPRYS